MTNNARLAPDNNQRVYFAVVFKSEVPHHWDFGNGPSNIPGFVHQDLFVHAVRILSEYDCRSDADSGRGYRVVRTGWDNVHGDGRFEEITPLPGTHYAELPTNEQQGIATFCQAADINLPLHLEQLYTFAPHEV